MRNREYRRKRGIIRKENKNKMNYVYVRNIKNGREEFMRGFADTDDAINHIAKCYREEFMRGFADTDDAINRIARCYRIDKELGQLGEYYYFVVQH